MKNFVLLFGILGFGIFSNAQSSLPKNVSDSLWGIWLDDTKHDSLRMQSMYDIVWDGYLFTQPDSALYYSHLLISFASSRGHHIEVGAALYAQGVAYFFKGQHNDAITKFLHSLEIHESKKYQTGISNTITSLGVVYSAQGNFDKAITYYTRGLKIAESAQKKSIIASTLNNLASLYVIKGEFNRALELYQISSVLYFELGDKRGYANVVSNLGSIYLNQGDLLRALENFNRCLEIKTEINDKKGIGSAMVNVGSVYMHQEKYIEAIEIFLQCEKIQEEIQDLAQLSATLSNLGIIYHAINQDTDAIICIEKAIKIREQLFDLAGLSESLNIRAKIDRDKKLISEALNWDFLSYQYALQTGFSGPLQDASKSLYLDYLLLNEVDSAKYYLSVLISSLESSVATNFFTLSEHEKELYFASMENDFAMCFDFTTFHYLNYPELADTAYNMALINKGLTLKSSNAMRSAILNSSDSLLIRDYENWIQLKSKIAETYSKKENTQLLENKAIELEKELVKKSGAFNDFDKIKNLNWRHVKAALKPNECAIEFVNFQSDIDTNKATIYTALLINSESVHPEIIQLCTETELKEILGVTQGNNLTFANTVYGKKEAPKTDLYQKIWQPIEPFLGGVKTIYYSPTGLLHKISFTAISTSQNVFLSDLYHLRQMGSTGSIAKVNNIVFNDAETFLLMGGVTYNSKRTTKEIWSYLPGSLQETDVIHSYLQKKNYAANYFIAEDASEENFKKNINGASIVHVATHGFFFADPDKVREEMISTIESNKEITFRSNDVTQTESSANYANWSFVNNKNPLMRSGIVLAGANDVWQRNALAEGEDGILTAQEVSNLDLRNTKLVVLSACETGLGDIKGSEGVFGLQRAFKMAGVKYLIMSLWQVPDKETSEFMILFYKNLLKIKDVPLAFQKTQKVMREKYDPYFWGAFVLIE